MITINEIDIPAGTHPDVFRALQHLRAYMSQNSDPASKDGNLKKGFALIKQQMEVHKDDPLIEFIFSLFAYLIGNPESAAFFAARAILLQPNFQTAREALPEYLLCVGARETPEKYLSLAVNGSEECIQAYWGLGRQYFKKGDLAMADHYVQRATALKFTTEAKVPDYASVLASMKQHMANGTYEKEMERHWLEKEENFTPDTEDSAKVSCDKWIKMDNKHQVARHVAQLLAENKAETPVCVELGCHMGALMQIIKKGAEQLGVEPKMIGIEPDPNPVALGHKQFPSLTIYEGDHEGMASGKIPLPERISVLLMSYLCLLLRPEWMEDVIRFASGCCDRIVILDDLSNTEGEFAVPRRFYLLHPYRQILERHGFHIKTMIFAEQPDLAVNGILEAENNRFTDT